MNRLKQLGDREKSNPFSLTTVVSLEEGDWNADQNELQTSTAALFDLVVIRHLEKVALKPISPETEIEVSFLFTNDENVHQLNHEFRGFDKATNVLSFPDTELTDENLSDAKTFDEPLCLGDIALAEETIKKEALEQNKDFEAHLIHLIIHGLLHLLGYDHIEDADAEIMENLEIKLLSELGIDNPYAVIE